MSDESVKAAAAFQDSLQDLQTAFGGLKRGLTEDFMPGITTVMNGLTQIFSGDSDSGIAMVSEGVDSVLTSLTDNLPMFLETGVAILDSLLQAFIDNLPKLLEMGAKLIAQLVAGLISSIPTLLKSVPEIIKAIISGLVAGWPSIRDAGKDLIQEVGNGIMAMFGKAKEWGGDLLQNFIDGIKAKIQRLKDAVSNVATTVKNFLGFSEPKEGPLSNFHTYAPDMMELFAQGIRDNAGMVANQLNRSLDFGAVGSASFAGVGLPSGAGYSGFNTQPIVIDLTAVLDGAVVARKLHSLNAGESNRVGMSLVQGD